jgi:hypothetical protein
MIRKVLGLVFAVVVVCAAPGFAHPPQDIQISYDATTKILTAVILHVVSNPANHFIGKVDVGINGKEILEHTISRQDNGQMQTVTYRIPDVNPGDVVSVEGYCSISGKLEKEIKVGE